MDALTFSAAVRQFKRQLLASALDRAKGNRTHAAQALGLPRTYLLRLLRDLAVDAAPSPFSPDGRRRARAAAPVPRH